MGKFIAVLLISLFSVGALAKPELPADVSSRTVEDDEFQYNLVEFTNEYGEHEVQVFLIEDRKVGLTTQRLLVIGRATKGGGSKDVDTWFIPGKSQLYQSVEAQVPPGADPWPTAKSVIDQNIKKKKRWFAKVLFEAIAPHVSLALGHHYDVFERAKREEINLLDLEARVERLKIVAPNDPRIEIFEQIIADGWQAISKSLSNEKTYEIWLLAAADVGIVVAGGKAVSIAGRYLGRAAFALKASRLVSHAKSIYGKMATAVAKKAAAAARKVVPVAARRLLAIPFQAGGNLLGRAALAKLAIAKQAEVSLQYLALQGHMGAIASQMLTFSYKTIASAVAPQQLIYLAENQLVQAIAEVRQRPDDLFDYNPIIMTKKMLKDKDFMQNFLFQSMDTFWQAGLSARFSGSPVKNLIANGIVSIGDSTISGFTIKSSGDPTRTVLDATWQVSVGNVQTIAEYRVMNYFTNLAAHSGNTKLKYLGNLFVLVDEYASSEGYAWITRKYETWKRDNPGKDIRDMLPHIKAIPIFSEDIEDLGEELRQIQEPA